MTKKEAEKFLKYKNQRMWNVKATAIPVLTEATGTISISLRRYLSNIPGKHEIKVLQKTIVLGTAHILCTAATNVTVQNIFHGRNNMKLARTVNKGQLQHYIP